MAYSLMMTLIITLVSFSGIWLINVITRNAGVIDYYWGPGFVVIAGIHFFIHGQGTTPEFILLFIVILWAGRLTWHLILRQMKSTEEDGRYHAMRQNGGKQFWWKSFFTVFMLQAILLWIIASPLHVAFYRHIDVQLALFWLGIFIFSAGFLLEWSADRQLETGKVKQSHKKTGTSLYSKGFWSKSRHPNYLGEMILWWGISISAFSMSGSWIAFIGPVFLTVVMITISIPLTEQHMIRTRNAYRAYQEAVPMLFSWRTIFINSQKNQAAE